MTHHLLATVRYVLLCRREKQPRGMRARFLRQRNTNISYICPLECAKRSLRFSSFVISKHAIDFRFSLAFGSEIYICRIACVLHSESNTLWRARVLESRFWQAKCNLILAKNFCISDLHDLFTDGRKRWFSGFLTDEMHVWWSLLHLLYKPCLHAKRYCWIRQRRNYDWCITSPIALLN